MKKFAIPTLLAFVMCIVACSKSTNDVSPIQAVPPESRVIGKIQSTNVTQVPNNAELEGMLSDQFARVLQISPINSREAIKIRDKQILLANNKYYLATTVDLPGNKSMVMYTLLIEGANGELIASDTTYSCKGSCETCEVVIDRTNGGVSCNCRTGTGSTGCVLKD